MVEVFPALFRPPPITQADHVIVEGDASCFYHATKKAVMPCDHCGRFLCDLCNVEMNGQHLCSTCLETGKKKGRLVNLQNKRTLYDSMTLSLAILPIIAWPFTIITAPATIYMVMRYRKEPLSILRRSRFRFWLALVIASLQLAVWVIVGSIMLIR